VLAQLLVQYFCLPDSKERGGKIIWERPDTGFWVSQEMALHLLERKSAEERRA